MNAPSPEVRAGLTKLRHAIETVPRLTMESRQALWEAFGQLRDTLYREAAGETEAIACDTSPVLPFFDSPLVVAARAGE